MTNKQQKRLNELMGQSWMYRTNTYEFRSFKEEGQKVLIVTNSRVINVQSSELNTFFQECLPTEDLQVVKAEPMPARKQPRVLQPTIAEEMLQSMMGSLRELDDAEDDAQLQRAVKRATAKSKTASAITNLVKVQLMANKHAGA